MGTQEPGLCVLQLLCGCGCINKRECPQLFWGIFLGDILTFNKVITLSNKCDHTIDY